MKWAEIISQQGSRVIHDTNEWQKCKVNNTRPDIAAVASTGLEHHLIESESTPRSRFSRLQNAISTEWKRFISTVFPRPSKGAAIKLGHPSAESQMAHLVSDLWLPTSGKESKGQSWFFIGK